jgi:small-conductance mechanosensitive channel
LIGFFVGLAVLGVDLTKVTILAGAFTVGVGFGLQTVINNFVSGLILLFERPIKVGDTIQIDTDIGEVRRIGIRACIIRTADGSEVIVPNGEIIANKVTNWTGSDRYRAIEVPITIARGVTPQQVIGVLQRTRRNSPASPKNRCHKHTWSTSAQLQSGSSFVPGPINMSIGFRYAATLLWPSMRLCRVRILPLPDVKRNALRHVALVPERIAVEGWPFLGP